ncbi:MAG: D-alanine--D-alanine ligase [Bacillota bacterium]
MRVAVLLGGQSAEREVSLKSGEAVYRALVGRGRDVVKIDVGPDVAQRLQVERADVAFIALHGKGGEDGSIQGLLEIMGVPYTGSGILASAIAMDKVATKRLLLSEGLPTPRFVNLKAGSCDPLKTEDVLRKIRLPLVVKPATQGSSVGMTVVRKEEELAQAIKDAFRYDTSVLVEEFVAGPEVTASVLGNERPVVLPLLEITTAKGVYDYEAKYTPGMSDHLIPPRIPIAVQRRVEEIALVTYKLLGCKGFARVDFIVGSGSQPYVLEVNTIPGLTEVSLFPDAARAAGISFSDLVERLISLALGQEE